MELIRTLHPSPHPTADPHARVQTQVSRVTRLHPEIHPPAIRLRVNVVGLRGVF